MRFRYLHLGAGVVLALWLTGCGLISSDVTNFDLSLPDKTFTIDTGGWQVDPMALTVYRTPTCTMSISCASAVQRACPMGCTGTCGESMHCDLSLDISLAQPVNLLAEKPELKSINDEPVIKVTIDSVTYEVTSNTLSVDTPDIIVYVAPASVTLVKQDDPTIIAIATIAGVPAGQTTSGPQSLMFSLNGKAALVKIMSSFKTPFNVLIGSSILVTAGQPLPTGKLAAVVRIKGHAGV